MPGETLGYEPSDFEERKARESMTENEAEGSRTRERATREAKRFSATAERYEEFLRVPEDKKVEESLKISGGDLSALYGEGLPLKHAFHDFHNLTSVVAPHSFFSKAGYTLVDEVKNREGVDEKAIEAAQSMVDAYEENCKRIISKSPTLQALLAPMERGRETEITDEDLAVLEDLGIYTKKIREDRSWVSYTNQIEPAFGYYFREVARQIETPEEFEDFRKKMEAAFEKLRSL